MPQKGRLADLEKNLELLYERLGAMERSRIMAYDAEAKISIDQRIREEIAPQIRQTEAAYWQLLAQQANSFEIDETEANRAIVEVVNVVEQIEQSDTQSYPDEVIQLLIEIRDKLNDSGQPAAAKLKAALPLLPPFISYEMELDTESVLRQMFPTFSRLFRGARKK